MITKFFSWLMSICFKLLINVLDVIFNLFGFITIPAFSDFNQWIINFWDMCFEGVGYIRSAFLIGSFEMNLIYTILIIRFTYKPLIAVVKTFIHWWDKIKL